MGNKLRIQGANPPARAARAAGPGPAGPLPPPVAEKTLAQSPRTNACAWSAGSSAMPPRDAAADTVLPSPEASCLFAGPSHPALPVQARGAFLCLSADPTQAAAQLGAAAQNLAPGN